LKEKIEFFFAFDTLKVAAAVRGIFGGSKLF